MYTSWQSFSNVLERKIRHSTHGKECCTTCEQQTKDFFFHFPLRKNSPSQLRMLTQFYWFCVWTVPLQIPKYGFVQDDAKANQQKLCVGKVFSFFFCQAHLPFSKTLCVAQGRAGCWSPLEAFLGTPKMLQAQLFCRTPCCRMLFCVRLSPPPLFVIEP